MDLKDEKLINDLIIGNRASFDNFYSKYHIKIYNTALSYVKNEQNAEEILQDVIVKIFKSASSFKRESSVKRGYIE